MKSCDEITKDVLARRDAHNEKVKKRNRMIMQIGVPTVSLCLALVVGIGFMRSEDTHTAEDAVVPGIKDVVKPSEDEGEASNAIGTVENDYALLTEAAGGKDECPPDDEIWIEPQWGEKALYSKYSEFELSGKVYYTAATWIEESDLGETIGTSTAKGYDIYTDTEYTMDVTVYRINGISTDAAVAVSYNGFEGRFAVYTDTWYKPETLGELIDALDLRENLTFGTVYHTFWEYESFMTVEYSITDSEVIWDMLFSDTNLVNVTEEVTDEEMSNYRESMSISVSVGKLGEINKALTVSENGYLSTNILGTRKLFYIGEATAKDFFGYVRENFEPVREEIPSTTAVTEPAENTEDTVVTAVTEVTEISPPYIPDGIVVDE